MEETNKQFKDDHPLNTISRIKKKLEKINISVCECWKNENLIHTFSLRLSIEGTRFGVNGKGITPDLARASAYGELMERLQNNAIIPKGKYNELGFSYCKDEVALSIEEIIDSNSSVIEMLFKRMGIESSDREIKFEALETILSYDADNKKEFLCLPFLNVQKNKLEYIPYRLVIFYFRSNGMCSGNTDHEALVQGLCEIYERYCQSIVIKDRLTPPRIPEDCLKSFSNVYKMYEVLRHNPNFTIELRDCSLGKGLPVVALVLIEKGTGKYGINFGSHPCIEIAIERTFTEAMQGKNVDSFVKQGKLDLGNKYVDTFQNLYNIFSVGLGKYPVEFFGQTESYAFGTIQSIDYYADNAVILQTMLQDFMKLDQTLLIRNNSVLDFPSYHIIIPELSAIDPLSLIHFKYENSLVHIIDLISHPSKITMETVPLVISVVEYYMSTHGKTYLTQYHERQDDFLYPFSKERLDVLFFLSIMYYANNDLKSSLMYLKRISNSESLNKELKSELAIRIYYIESRILGYDISYVMEIMCCFFDEKELIRIFAEYSDEKLIISRIYPDDINCKKFNQEEEMMLEKMLAVKKNEIQANINQKNILAFIKEKELLSEE